MPRTCLFVQDHDRCAHSLRTPLERCSILLHDMVLSFILATRARKKSNVRLNLPLRKEYTSPSNYVRRASPAAKEIGRRAKYFLLIRVTLGSTESFFDRTFGTAARRPRVCTEINNSSYQRDSHSGLCIARLHASVDAVTVTATDIIAVWTNYQGIVGITGLVVLDGRITRHRLGR